MKEDKVGKTLAYVEVVQYFSQKNRREDII
jgi:hypothetical protein